MEQPTCCTHECNSGRSCPLRYHPETKRAQMQGISAVIGVAALFVLFLLVLGSLGGCTRAEVRAAEVEQTIHNTVIYRDQETGCEYVASDAGAALYPRMGRDGKQICREKKLVP